MNLRQQAAELKSAMQAIVAGAKAEGRELTEDEATDIEAKATEHDSLIKRAETAEKATRLVADLAGSAAPEPEADKEPEAAKGSIADRFVKSEAFRAFRKSHPSGVGDGTPFRIEAKGVGGVAELGIGRKATITTETGQYVSERRLPGYRSDLIDEPVTFLDLVTTGTTDASFIEYAKIISENDNAAVVAEGALKPLSDVTTDRDDAKAYTYADGFDITNQTLSDDGALAAFLESRIRWHLRNLVEDKLLNGTGTAGDPRGILNTTGTQAQAFDTDVVTTLAMALEKVDSVQVAAQAIVMNPADIWRLRLLRENGANGAYLLGNPLQQGVNPTPFGVPLVKSNRVAAGTALVGNFSSVQFLEREPLSVLAFNQHKDYAQRNMTYVRAELRALQFVYAPREIVVASIADAG